MTPNPKNIGAAPEEYPIRARVRADAKQKIWSHMPRPGSEIWVTQAGDSFWCSEGFVWHPASLDLLPPQEGVALPDPQAKGPSLPEVTQPGEGVDLEAERKAFNAWWPSVGQTIGEVAAWEAWKARATLRRESK